MPHAARMLQSSSALFLIGCLSVVDAYYIASIRSSPTQPQGRPQWGWLPTQPRVPGTVPPCHLAGNPEIGYLQAIGVINRATTPPGGIPGDAEGFIFYDGPDCDKSASQKMVYVRFDPLSPNPQYANFRNLVWGADPEMEMSLADNDYWSFREVSSPYEDKDLPYIPVYNPEPPKAFVYPMEAYYDNEGNKEWAGEILPDSVMTIEVPNAGMIADPSVLAFDSLVSLMSALGQDIATQQQLMQYATDDFPGNRGFAGENPLARLGTQRASPSRMLNVGTQGMEPLVISGQWRDLSPQMQLESQAQQPPGQNDPLSQIRLLGSEEVVDTTGEFRGRSRHPFYSQPETPEQDIDISELQMNIENPSDIPSDQFNPMQMVSKIREAWLGLINDNGDMVQMSEWTGIAPSVRGLVDEGIRLLQVGQAWMDNLDATLDRLITAQQSMLAAIDDAAARRYEIELQYEANVAAIDEMVAEYQNILLPTPRQTEIVQQAPGLRDSAVLAFNAAVDPIDRELNTYEAGILDNERDFAGFAVRAYQFMQRIELRLRQLRRELDLDDPVEIVGLVNQQNDGTDEFNFPSQAEIIQTYGESPIIFIPNEDQAGQSDANDDGVDDNVEDI